MGASVAAPIEAAARRPLAAYTRVAAVGLALAAATPVFMAVAGLLAGQAIGGDLPFFGGTAALGTAGALAVLRLGIAGKVIGILASVLMALALFWTAFGLAVPAAFADFVAGVMLLLGVVLGLGGSSAALVAGRRGRLQASPGRTERRILQAAFVVLALAVVGSGVASVLGRTSVPQAAAAGATPVKMQDFQFAVQQGPLEVAAEQPTALLLHNSDAFVHDFAIPAIGLEPVTVLPGSEQLVEITAPAGTYTAYCTLHADTGVEDPEAAGMALTVVAR